MSEIQKVGENEKMTAKEYLSQIAILKTKIQQKQQELQELFEFDGLSATRYDAQKSTKQARDAAFVRTIEKRDILANKINKMISKYIFLKNKIIAQIHEVDNVSYIQILYKKYVEFKRLEDIADEMSYSHDRIRHLHGEALQAFTRKHGAAGKFPKC